MFKFFFNGISNFHKVPESLQNWVITVVIPKHTDARKNVLCISLTDLIRIIKQNSSIPENTALPKSRPYISQALNYASQTSQRAICNMRLFSTNMGSLRPSTVWLKQIMITSCSCVYVCLCDWRPPIEQHSSCITMVIIMLCLCVVSVLFSTIAEGW